MYPSDSPSVGEMSQTNGAGVAVHPQPAPVTQDRPFAAPGDSPVEGTADGGWQRYLHDPVALAVDFEDAVAVFFAEVGDLGAGGFEDPQAEQPEHRDQGEVVRVCRLAGRGQHRFELQVGQPEGG